MAASLVMETAPSVFSPRTHSRLTSPNTEVCKTNNDVYKKVAVVKLLSKAKFPVYLVESQVNGQDYVMKIFPFAGNKPHLYFKNESRFSFVSHPNIIKTHFVEQERETVSQAGSQMASYTIMEYAPYGDVFDLLTNYGDRIDDKLIRTYFRQLIEGLQYLHNNGVAHMDLKLENLLIGNNFTLKIADFDLSAMIDDPKILSKGTQYYRAIEVIQQKCEDGQAADIYSAGIILFTLKTRGMLPHAEEKRVAGIDFAGLLYTKNDEFWAAHCKVQKKDKAFFDDDFKELFNAMVGMNPQCRPSISQIKKSKWYNGPVYTQKEVENIMGKLF